MIRHDEFLRLAAVVAAMLCGCHSTLASELATSLRRPVAISLSADEQWLYVANQRSGSLSVIDIRQREVVAEYPLGRRLSDLIFCPERSLGIASDEEAHELLVLHIDGPRVSLQQRVPVSPYPVKIVLSGDGRQCYVTSLWSRRVSIIDLPQPDQPDAVAQQLDLPFAPREAVLVPDRSRLIVADAFGGRLGLVNVAAWSLEAVRDFPAHNIRGLELSANQQTLVIAHQILNELAHSVRNDVHWGLLMSNDLRWLKVRAVLDTSGSIYRDAHIHPLGSAGSATGDPSGLAVANDGTVLVTLGGVGEIAVGKEHDFGLSRITVGRRPTAVCVTNDSRHVYVANTLGDSISVVDLSAFEAVAEVSLGPQPDLTLVDRGEQLFYDASLSHDRWMSCHSCHTDGHTNGMLNDNLSDDSYGAPKRILSLLGHFDTAPLAWDGQTPDHATQIRNSIVHTMQSDRAPREGDVEALEAFLKTLPPPPPLDRLRGTFEADAVARGRRVFEQQDCAACHQPPTYTSAATYDVGLEDEKQNRDFNPPSLIGVGQRGPYFHDNRAAQLEDVFRLHSHPLQTELSDDQLADLVAFLRSL